MRNIHRYIVYGVVTKRGRWTGAIFHRRRDAKQEAKELDLFYQTTDAGPHRVTKFLVMSP